MSPPNRLKYDPNPHFGHVSNLDKALAFVGYVVVAVQAVFFFLVRFLRSKSGPLRKELVYFLVPK